MWSAASPPLQALLDARPTSFSTQEHAPAMPAKTTMWLELRLLQCLHGVCSGTVSWRPSSQCTASTVPSHVSMNCSLAANGHSKRICGVLCRLRTLAQHSCPHTVGLAGIRLQAAPAGDCRCFRACCQNFWHWRRSTGHLLLYPARCHYCCRCTAHLSLRLVPQPAP